MTIGFVIAHRDPGIGDHAIGVPDRRDGIVQQFDRAALGGGGFSVMYNEYDWNLNKQ